MFRQLFAPVLRLAWHVMVRLTPDGDPWERLNVAPRLHMYGGGSRREFSQYLTGPSRVAVSSLGAIQDWLLDCRYETDETLFAEPDFWQHPTTFEHLRAGDCEDFSLWAWRKLVELQFDVDLVAGYCLKDGQLAGRHVWLVFRQDGAEFLFEPVFRTKERMIRPLNEARADYLPEFGVDRTGHRFAFSGYIIGQKRLLQAKPKRRTA